MRLNEDGKTVAAMDVLAPGIGEAIKILGSPVIPSFIAPKIPVPLAQNRTIIATKF